MLRKLHFGHGKSFFFNFPARLGVSQHGTLIDNARRLTSRDLLTLFRDLPMTSCAFTRIIFSAKSAKCQRQETRAINRLRIAFVNLINWNLWDLVGFLVARVRELMTPTGPKFKLT